jgi:N-acetylmuramoyl-L-alanine amidase
MKDDQQHHRSNLFPLSSKNSSEARRLYQDLELDVMARTVWGEARGEGITGMQAVAHVIVNRVIIAQKMGGYWWGNTILQVCQKPYQFSCWNKDDPNRRLVIAVNEESDPLFATAKRTCSRVLLGFLPDITGGADHYHARNILPHWAQGQTPSARIGRHIFYKLMKGH